MDMALTVCHSVSYENSDAARVACPNGKWVREASRHGQILVTDNGRTIAKILPDTGETGIPYFARRQPSKTFTRLDESGKALHETLTSLRSCLREDLLNKFALRRRVGLPVGLEAFGQCAL